MYIINQSITYKAMITSKQAHKAKKVYVLSYPNFFYKMSCLNKNIAPNYRKRKTKMNYLVYRKQSKRTELNELFTKNYQNELFSLELFKQENVHELSGNHRKTFIE